MKTSLSRTRKSLCLLAATATVAVAAVGLTAGAASADPPAGETRPIVGVGSDTTDPVMNALADAITVNGTKPLASYDALGPTFRSRGADNAACEYLDNRPGNTSDPNLRRPNGSGSGRTALVNAITEGHARFGCLDYSRSSSLNLASTGEQRLTYIPFALDGLTYAVRGDSTIPRDLTKADLVAIYSCQRTNYQPLIPQAGSGTRGSWLSYVGLTEAQVTSSECVKDTYADPANGGAQASVQEHDGRALVSKTAIVPFSASQWSAQSIGSITDRRFGAVLGGIEGIPAIDVNPNSAAGTTRTVYNVVPFSRIGSSATAGDTLLNQVFVGSDSEICGKPDVISRFGLATVTTCGQTTQTTP